MYIAEFMDKETKDYYIVYVKAPDEMIAWDIAERYEEKSGDTLVTVYEE